MCKNEASQFPLETIRKQLTKKLSSPVVRVRFEVQGKGDLLHIDVQLSERVSQDILESDRVIAKEVVERLIESSQYGWMVVFTFGGTVLESIFSKSAIGM